MKTVQVLREIHIVFRNLIGIAGGRQIVFGVVIVGTLTDGCDRNRFCFLSAAARSHEESGKYCC